MSNLKYTTDHEWIRLDPDGTALVGITDHAQDALGDVVFIELPQTGRKVVQGEDTAVIESVKAAGDLKMPVAGEIVEVNQAIADDPGMVNRDPQGAAWFVRMKPSDLSQFETLMDEAGYRAFLDTL